MKLKVYSGDFSSCAETDVPDVIRDLGASKGIVALKQYLTAFNAGLRQGNACAKDRGDVSGSGKKPYRQKGTGMARHGSKRSPIWSGGGVVFGPKPRDYSQKVNKRVKRLALMRALYDKVADGELAVIDQLRALEPKTKVVNDMLLPVFGRKAVLFVDDVFDRNFVLASGNISYVFMVEGKSLNAFDVVRHKNVVISESAMKTLVGRLTSEE